MLNISHRELRFTIGRALHAAGLAAGAVNPVRDVLVDAQGCGVDVVSVLLDAIPRLPGRHGQVTWTVSSGRLLVDAGGQPAFLVAPAALDLAAVAARRDGAVTVEISESWATETLAGLPGRGLTRGIRVSAPKGAVFTAVPGPAGQPPSPLAAGGWHVSRLLSDGASVPAELWWRLYHYSSDALTPDSELSRTHAGASAYDANGRVIGEIGEDYEG